MRERSEDVALQDKWRVISILSLAELLAMTVWFSASAVIPQLSAVWSLNASTRAWLTMSVQAGFVTGAVISALLNLSDRVPAPHFFTWASILAAISTASIPFLAQGPFQAILYRFFTGLFLAGVYPVGMKIMATWTQKDRGFGIALLVGALTVGSAAPHLINFVSAMAGWHFILYTAGCLALVGAVLARVFVYEGPYKRESPPFNWKYAIEIFRQRELLLTNLGYLGHMWELYAMWAWLPIFLAARFAQAGFPARYASLTAFAAIGIGGLGCVVAGRLADSYGRTTIIIASLLLSGVCSVCVGLLFGGSLFTLIVICLIWGFAVVADSAQFSASISELCNPQYTGTAITLQTCLGFLLTLFTIRLIPSAEAWWGWEWAFAILGLGPAVGIWAMICLRRLPAARKLGGGKK